MIKVGIVTLNGNYNYGNRLQNYALQEFLKKIKCKSETIWEYNNSTFIIKEKIKNILNALKLREKRKHNFEIFSKEKLNIKYVKSCNLKKEKYDFYIAGSDQVWNPDFASNEVELLSFTTDDKKISYSASLGVDEIDTNTKKLFEKYISKYKAISVREEKGKEILENITHRKDIEVLVDPTMLLTTEEWDQVSKRPKQLDSLKEDKYILNYFLGDLSESRKCEIERIAKENNCHIINILDKNDPFYESGPSEFLYLEKNAFLICTDSFHSSVFAILYNKPFVIFNREQHGVENMNSRIDTLIKKFKLKNRKYNEHNITKDNIQHDYTEAYKILEKEREKSKHFLYKSLNIKDSDYNE